MFNLFLLSSLLYGLSYCGLYGNVNGGLKSGKIELTPWVLSDWDSIKNDFSSSLTNPALKDYLYSSILPFQTPIFCKPGQCTYQFQVYTTNWGNITAPVPNVGVPGPFLYTEDYSHWGGDEKYHVGQYRYAGILSDFGHEHILVIQMRNAKLSVNQNADTTNEDLSLLSLAGGSSFIFGWFGQIVDLNGNYNFPSYPPCNQADFLKLLIIGFVFGNGEEYGKPGANVDLNAMGQVFDQFIGATNGTVESNLTAIKNQLFGSLTSQLRLAQSNPLPLVAWDPLMKAHQHHTSSGWATFTKLFSSANYKKAGPELAESNKMYMDGVVFGRQMGAFFSAFYGFVNFLDKAMPLAPGESYVIPMAYHLERSAYIFAEQERTWREHVTMFEDYNKASALNNQAEMHRIRTTMLKSCSSIATTLGEVFRAFDTLVRHRHIFDKLVNNTMPCV